MALKQTTLNSKWSCALRDIARNIGWCKVQTSIRATTSALSYMHSQNDSTL